MGKIIAFANQKGGIGKTTTCINVSASMALMGKKVLLIDIDPQGNASSGVGIKKTPEMKSIYNLITGDATLEQVLQNTSIETLDILPANIDLAGVEVEMVYMENREKISISGVKNTVNFDDKIIVLETQMGEMTIKGENLNISKMDIDTGNLEVLGNIYGLIYNDLSPSKSILKRLFK